MANINQTTTTATTAGAAFGGIVAWGLSLINGVTIPVEIAGLFATLGAFAFGAILPRQ